MSETTLMVERSWLDRFFVPVGLRDGFIVNGCLHAPIEVLPPCRGGKRQKQQCGEDAFHVRIGYLTSVVVFPETVG